MERKQQNRIRNLEHKLEINTFQRLMSRTTFLSCFDSWPGYFGQNAFCRIMNEYKFCFVSPYYHVHIPLLLLLLLFLKQNKNE